MPSPLFISVDLGAGSGRVFLCGIGPGELLLQEVKRFHYPPREKNGALRWDFCFIFDQIKIGLELAASRAKELGRSIDSIGVDSWAVDYGLLDADGKLIDDPVCYRDERTSGAMETAFKRVPRHSIFERTGIQFQNFNTLFQLSSDGTDLELAAKLLLLPDLINFFLTGTAAAEFTNATTTQMVSASSGAWDTDLLDRLEISTEILPNIIAAGTDLGKLKPEIAIEVGLPDSRVIATASHDTASAIAAAPMSSECTYISSGTWSLIGVETDTPLINDEVERQNFTNEGGVFGTIRFLKNVMGLWIFESCRREWKERGVDLRYDDILNEVSRRNGYAALIFPDDKRFLNPPSMLRALKQQLKETGQTFKEDPVSIAKMIFDSLAFRYASVLHSIECLTGRKRTGIHILGGGGRNRYLNQMTANTTRMQVKAGLFEATVIGNVLVQAISAGRFSSLSEARDHVVNHVELIEYLPNASDDILNAADRYAEIEKQFVDCD